MNSLVLYAFPGSCSNVSMIAMEEAGIEYSTKLIRLMKGEHKQPEYLAVNPKAKVPALSVDGEIFTENPAIISCLNHLYPNKAILPSSSNKLQEIQQISDLCFISASVHPLITRLCKPEFFGSEASIESITEKAKTALEDAFRLIEQKLDSSGSWWYGDEWSAMDAYIFWVFNRVIPCGFDVSRYPKFVSHDRNMRERAGVKSALEKIKALQSQI